MDEIIAKHETKPVSGETAARVAKSSMEFGPKPALYGDSQHPFDVDHKQAWDGSRFGYLHHTVLGSLQACTAEEALYWPEYDRTFVSQKGYSLLYKKVDVEREAERVAEIYRRAIDEMVGNSHYEWHHKAEHIRNAVRGGDYAIYGTYQGGVLISVNSLELFEVIGRHTGCGAPFIQNIAVKVFGKTSEFILTR